MKILLFCSSYNGLSQTIHQELKNSNHEVSIEFAISSQHLEEAVFLFKPDLILAPFLKQIIPSSIYENNLCLIFHPGIIGDRGPSSLDWAILKEKKQWGVTVLEATKDIDGGNIWASSNFKMPKNRSKASIYRDEVTKASIICLHKVLENYKNKEFKAFALDYKKAKGNIHPLMTQKDRELDFSKDKAVTILKKINASDSFPGVLTTLLEEEYFLYGAHLDNEISIKNSIPGQIIAKRNSAIAIATIDKVIWITHLRKKEKNSYKLPSTIVLKDKLKGIKENRIPLLLEEKRETFYEISYKQKDEIGYLYFDFYNGAMSIEQCVRLKYAYEVALTKDIKILVLMGGKEFFSNGIHLNIMEESLKSDEDGWSNIHAMNDIVKTILETSEIITVASLGSNAGAGGAILALACDFVVAKQSSIINPHYKTLGLHGSEYWTYLLPKKIGSKEAYRLVNEMLPINTKEALKINFCDKVYKDDNYLKELQLFALSLEDDFYDFLDLKAKRRKEDEKIKTLDSYRKEELAHMHKSFFDKDSLFNSLRCEFVYKKHLLQTPRRLAKHRD